MRRKRLFLWIGALLLTAIVSATISFSRHLGRVSLIEIDAVGTEFHFPGGAGSRADKLELRLDVRDANLLSGPPPIDRNSIQEWLSMTWPGSSYVMVCDSNVSPADGSTTWRVELLVDFETVPNARALLLAVSEGGGPVRGTVLMMVGPSYLSGREVHGPQGFLHWLAHGVYWEYRALWLEPESLERSPGCGSTYGVKTTLDLERVRPLLERIGDIVEGMCSDRIRAISECVEGMVSPAEHTWWCHLVNYRGEELPLLLHASSDGAVVEMMIKTTSLELYREVKLIVNEE